MDNHIAKVQLNDETWFQAKSWFYVRNLSPERDYTYDADNKVLYLKGNNAITQFHQHFPNLDYTTVSL